MGINNISITFAEITDASHKVPLNVLRAFIRTNRAFETAMASRGHIEPKITWDRTQEVGKANATVIDLPTYQHLPKEFLQFSDVEKAGFIKELCIQHVDVTSNNTKKWDLNRDAYVSSLYGDTLSLLQKHLHVEIPEKFTHMHVMSVGDLVSFMNMRWFHSDQEKLYHCMLLKGMFLMHIIRSTIDLDNLPKVLTAIRQKIERHSRITILGHTTLSQDEWGDKIHIAYTATGTTKPRSATLAFGGKKIFAIFDKLARKPDYMSPDMLNDLSRMTVEFEEEVGDDDARIWLIQELKKITFGNAPLKMEMNTKSGHLPIIKPKKIQEKFGDILVVKNIKDLHSIQITGNINPDLPKIRWVNTFELMCNIADVDWNAEWIGNRKIYKVERLQQAFARLATGAYGILKPGQVKYALQEYAQQEGLREKPEELLSLLLKEKEFLIPVNMLHRKDLCYRIKWIARPETSNLLDLTVNDLDPTDPALIGLLMRQFKAARITKPTPPTIDMPLL